MLFTQFDTTTVVRLVIAAGGLALLLAIALSDAPWARKMDQAEDLSARFTTGADLEVSLSHRSAAVAYWMALSWFAGMVVGSVLFGTIVLVVTVLIIGLAIWFWVALPAVVRKGADVGKGANVGGVIVCVVGVALGMFTIILLSGPIGLVALSAIVALVLMVTIFEDRPINVNDPRNRGYVD